MVVAALAVRLDARNDINTQNVAIITIDTRQLNLMTRSKFCISKIVLCV